MEATTHRPGEDTALVFELGYEYLMSPEGPPANEADPAPFGAYERLWDDGPVA